MGLSTEDLRALKAARREAARADGSLTHFRAVRFTDRKKEASRKACRGKAAE